MRKEPIDRNRVPWRKLVGTIVEKKRLGFSLYIGRISSGRGSGSLLSSEKCLSSSLLPCQRTRDRQMNQSCYREPKWFGCRDRNSLLQPKPFLPDLILREQSLRAKCRVSKGSVGFLPCCLPFCALVTYMNTYSKS